MKPWLSYAEASMAFGRSKRTLRRWAADPAMKIRTRTVDGEKRLHSGDVARVEAWKSAYIDAPTFGRKKNANVTNVTGVP